MNSISDVTRTCTECDHQISLPRQYFRGGNGGTMQFYCDNCNKVTLHTVVVSGPEPEPEPEVAASVARMADPPRVVNRFRYDPSQSQKQPSPQQSAPDVDLSDDALWRRLVQLLQENQVPLPDLFRCDDASRMRLFGTLGFDRYDQDRLLKLSYDRDPKSIVPPQPAAGKATPPPELSPPARGGTLAGHDHNLHDRQGGQLDRTRSGTSVAASAVSGAHTHFSNAQYGLGGPAHGTGHHAPGHFDTRSAVQYNARPRSGASPGGARRAPSQRGGPSVIPGVIQQGDRFIARCTVYPDLPAEFWCCACNCLVSSRCHVQGIHKDHPFISLRLAAETYVRDTASWAERCKTQLNITHTVIGNLRHAQTLLDQSVHHQFEALDKHVEQMVKDICLWRDTLKRDMVIQTEAEHRSIDLSVAQATDLHELFAEQLNIAEPLLTNMPPSTQHDHQSDDWALRFLDFVTKLKVVNADPVTMPKILVPEVRCHFAAASCGDLLKFVNNPVSVRLPDIIDPGYFHFPHPTSSTRTPFTLTMPTDGRQKGVHIENHRTLTRVQDTAPSHTLVTGSQVFYSGTTSWEVHVDRVGHGIGRILAGVIIQGSEGEGVVWDGFRIVGPNEGEVRTISEQYRVKAGTTLRFVLELDTPHSYLNCFFEKEGVARIPLPAANSGWVPAFSVFGPQDQLTVVPTQGAGAMEGAIPRNTSTHPSLTGADVATKAKLEQQELLIASMQTQLQDLSTKLQGAPATTAAPASGRTHTNARHDVSTPFSADRVRMSPGGRSTGGGDHDIHDIMRSISMQSRGRATPAAAAAAPSAAGDAAGDGGPKKANYGSELQQLLQFVEGLK